MTKDEREQLEVLVYIDGRYDKCVRCECFYHRQNVLSYVSSEKFHLQNEEWDQKYCLICKSLYFRMRIQTGTKPFPNDYQLKLYYHPSFIMYRNLKEWVKWIRYIEKERRHGNG